MGDPNLALYRAAIGQIMADAGITRSTIQEMVKQMIAEKVEKQFQYIAAHEVNTYSFRNMISNIYSDEIRKSLKDELRNISITVVTENKTPDKKSNEEIQLNDITRTIESWISSEELNLPPAAVWHLAAALGFCTQNQPPKNNE